MARILLFVAGFTVGLYLIFYSPDQKTSMFKIQSGVEDLGEVQSIQGQVLARLNGESNFLPVANQSHFSELTTIITEASSSTRLLLRGQGLIEIRPQSQIILDYNTAKKKIEVIVLQGQALSLQQGALNSFEIIQSTKDQNVSGVAEQNAGTYLINGRSETLMPAQSADAKSLPSGASGKEPMSSQNSMNQTLPANDLKVPSSVNSTHTERIDTNPASASQTLSSDYIRTLLDDQRRLVQACYLKYFNRQKGEVQIGRILMAFVIEPTGKTKNVGISQSDIKDKEFQDCLISMIQRTKFRPFQSAPIDMEYPIDIVLPN